jgi:hypothetical protein
MARPSRRQAEKLMGRLQAALTQRAKLDLEIVKLQNQFSVFGKDPKIPRRLGGCGYGAVQKKA